MQRRRPGAPLALGLLVALLAGCSESTEGPEIGRARIGPEGGTLSFAGATLTVPAGALSEATELRLLVGDLGAPEVPERVRISRVFQVQPEELKLLAPARLTIPYEADRIPDTVEAGSADLRRSDYTQALERLGAIAVDQSAGTVSGETLGLGVFWATTPTGPRPAWVEVTPAEGTLYVGQTLQLSVEVRDQTDRPMPEQPVVWGSSDEQVATVDATGHVAAVAPGLAEVSARAGAAGAIAKVRVGSTAPFAHELVWENPSPQGNPLRAVGGDGAKLFVAGDNGTIAVREGSDWSELFSAAGVSFEDLAAGAWGVVAAGSRSGQGVLAISRGERFDLVSVPETELLDVWTDGTLGIAVGAGPNLGLLGANGAWAAQPSPVTEPLLAGGLAAARLRVAGSHGSIYELDGEAWVALSPGNLPQLQIAAVLRGEEVYSVSRSALRRFTVAEGWSSVALPAEPALTLEEVGLAGDAVVIAGRDTTGQSHLLIEGAEGFTAVPLWPEKVNGIWGRSAIDLSVVCESGAIYAWNGSGWSSLRNGPIDDVVALAAFPGARVFAVANRCFDTTCWRKVGMVLERDSSGRFYEMAGEFTGQLRAVGGRSADDLWAVGDGVTYHWQDGAPVEAMVVGSLHALASCGEALYAAGNGKVFREEEGGWSLVYSAGYSTLRAIGCTGGTVFAAGDYAIVRIADGEGSVLDPTDDGIRPTLWRAVYVTPEGRAFIGGDARFILFWNGARFEYFDMPAGLSISRVASLWGTGYGDVWAAGKLGDGSPFLVHFDGAAWEKVETKTAAPLAAVRGLEDGTIWVAGERGAVLRGAR